MGDFHRGLRGPNDSRLVADGYCDMPVAAWRMNGSISRRCGVAAQGCIRGRNGGRRIVTCYIPISKGKLNMSRESHSPGIILCC